MDLRALGMSLSLFAAPALGQPLHIEEAAPAWAATIDFSRDAARFAPLDAALRADAARAFDAFKAQAAANAAAGQPFTFALTDRAVYVSERWFSVLRAVDTFTGGAHGMRAVEALTWDARAASAIGLDALVTAEGMEAISVELRARVAREVHGGALEEPWREAVNAATVASAMRLANFTIAPDEQGRPAGLDFHFNPYDIAPWSAGAPVVRAPLDSFAAHLTPLGASLFGR